MYFSNTNLIKSVILEGGGSGYKRGAREACYYGFVTNGYAAKPNLTNPNQPCNNESQQVIYPYYTCDSFTQKSVVIPPANSGNPGFKFIGCVSDNRWGPPTPDGPLNREPQMLFSPFPCETQFTQSMTEYEYVTYTALGFGGTPYNSGSALGNDSYPFGLASYIPSGSTSYEYNVIQLIPNCTFPSPSPFYEPGKVLLGPIAIVKGSAYYSVSYSSPKGDEPINPISQNMYFSPY